MSTEKAMKKVDWAWANQLTALPIFEAVALSLGHELGTLPPIGFEYSGKPVVDVPEHRERTIFAYEAARAGKLKLIGRSGFRETVFDLDAEFKEGQGWEVELCEFRKFCAAKGWAVPGGFQPIGYEVAIPTMALPPPAAAGVAASRVRAKGTPWTREHKSLLIADFKEATGKDDTAKIRSVAKLWDIKPRSLEKQLNAFKPKAKNVGVMGGMASQLGGTK